MPHLPQSVLIEAAKEITIAKLAGDSRTASKESGKHVAEFLQVVYEKLVELTEKP